MEIAEALRAAWTVAWDGGHRGIYALYFFALTAPMLYSIWYQLDILRWPAVSGKLLVSRLRKFGVEEIQPSDVDYVNEVAYEYTVNGQVYKGKRLSPWIVVATHNARFLLDWQRKVGNENGDVTVYYNPRRPERSFLKKPGYFGLLVTLLGTAFCAYSPILIMKP